MRNDYEQMSFKNTEAANRSVVCLGMTFENNENRREYFRNELRKKLPELKKIEGFPVGEDEDIIALSDPPYYTACPNPWINDFLNMWERKKENESGSLEEYHCEPFAVDVIAGKNDPIYNAHYYHTKVPYKAIQKYIFHYTNPGDIILDGFSGSGMTGVASQMCNFDMDNEIGDDPNKKNLGFRNSILVDLSPNASFIAKNNNVIGKVHEIDDIVESIAQKVKDRNENLIHTFHNGWKRGSKVPDDRKNSEIKTQRKGIIKDRKSVV